MTPGMYCRPSIQPRAAFLALMLLAGCAPVPAPVPPSPVMHRPPPAVPVPTVVQDWRDMPLTAGTWHYMPGDTTTAAVYGREGATPDLVLRCNRQTRQISLSRSGTATELVVTTSAGTERFPAGHVDDGAGAMSGMIFAATNPFLDRFVFSRGRVAIASTGLPTLAVPAWAEPARTVEDCRK